MESFDFFSGRIQCTGYLTRDEIQGLPSPTLHTAKCDS